MRSLPLSDATRRFGPPDSWDHARDGICFTLEVCDSGGWMISAWEPTEAERRRIAEGAPILLQIAGSPEAKHPVVSLTVPKP